MTLPYIRGNSETIARILQPYNIRAARKPITTLRRLLTNVQDKDKDPMLRLPLHWWNWQKPWNATDPTQTSDEIWWRQQSHCWAPFTDETSNPLGLCHMYYVFYRLLSTTHWFINLEQTPLNRIQHLPAQYKRLVDGIKQNWLQDNDWTTDNLTNNKRLSNCDNRQIEKHQWHYESS